MIRVFSEWRMRWHQRRMSELGQELLELMRENGWSRGEHRLYHDDSGVHFWVSNGRALFRLHDVAKLPYVADDYRKALNYHDKTVLWAAFEEMEKAGKQQPAAAALNVIRMYKMKGESK